tara:strand:+ start:979 stop:1152 length:174 start_codon:yes stop_codon:yes gene_type:complete
MKYQYQDNRICMFYVTERLNDILEIKDRKKAHKEVYEFHQEMLHNLGINALHNEYAD